MQCFIGWSNCGREIDLGPIWGLAMDGQIFSIVGYGHTF